MKKIIFLTYIFLIFNFTYADKLVEVQDPNEVDAVSGATVSNKEFKEAVWDALEKAKK